MKQFESLLYISILGLVGLFGIALQNSLLEEEPVDQNFNERHDPDYYIENFTATGLDKNGQRRFVIEAERLAHFPDDDTALLDYPHVIEYEIGFAPRHTYADSGWMNSTGDEILLTGNVRVVVEADSRGPGGEMKAKRMRILLDKSKEGSGIFN
ncbi:MAG: LPS export ABC transporter periplasmic protein LptC [Acidiferrobacterales bacterium]|nr:LPS export ABC transporter periplasmic protein LptC [Acidiferrobacterales bacterium]